MSILGRMPREIVLLAQKAQQEYGVPAHFSLAVIAHESGKERADGKYDLCASPNAVERKNPFNIRDKNTGNFAVYGNYEEAFDAFAWRFTDYEKYAVARAIWNKAKAVTREFVEAWGRAYCPDSDREAIAKGDKSQSKHWIDRVWLIQGLIERELLDWQ